MIAKMSIICPLLLVAGFITYSNSIPTEKPVSKTVMELHNEALHACSINSTSSMFQNCIHNEKQVDCMCPLICYAQSTGVINEGGVNKLAVNWTRDAIDYLFAHNEVFYRYELQGWKINYEARLTFWSNNRVHTFDDACALKNQSALNSFNSALEAIMRQPNSDYAIPSEEDSPMMELIFNTANTCSTKFNTSTFETAQTIFNKEFINHKKSACSVHCMFSELDIVSENGLNQPWAEILHDHSKPNAPAIVNEVLSLSPKCYTEYNELPDNYFLNAYKEILSKYDEA